MLQKYKRLKLSKRFSVVFLSATLVFGIVIHLYWYAVLRSSSNWNYIFNWSKKMEYQFNVSQRSFHRINLQRVLINSVPSYRLVDLDVVLQLAENMGETFAAGTQAVVANFLNVTSLVEGNDAFSVEQIKLTCKYVLLGQRADTPADVKRCLYNVVKYANLGGIPHDIGEVGSFENSYAEKEMMLKVSAIYTKDNSSTKEMICGRNNMQRHKRLYNILRAWIPFAARHNLLWWLDYGSFLGSERHGGIVPYDHDIDVQVLHIDEATIRKLATKPGYINTEKMNLLVRPNGYCPKNHGDRMDCNGRTVQRATDTCAVCTPLARVFFEVNIFMDIFMTHIAIQNDNRDRFQRFGLSYEEPFWGEQQRYFFTLKTIFPLKTCSFFSFKVPCPRDAPTVLSKLYGPKYLQPILLCDTSTGKWVGKTKIHPTSRE